MATIQDDDSSNARNAQYVYDNRFQSKANGRDWWVAVEIRNDSNANGLADGGDAVRAGVTVTVTFAGQTITGTTDSNGIFRTSWQRSLSSGNHDAHVPLPATKLTFPKREHLPGQDGSQGAVLVPCAGRIVRGRVGSAALLAPCRQ